MTNTSTHDTSTHDTSTLNTSRRHFLLSSAAVGSGLALGLSFAPDAIAQAAYTTLTPNEINLWVVIKPDDTVVIRIARSEMGQGTRTGLAQLVAEELDCDWSKVTTEMPTPGQSLARKRAWGDMSTGGSRGIRTSHDYVRRGGATARLMLMQAAANRWNVPVAEVMTKEGMITHAISGRTLSYGKVADDAAKLSLPDASKITLKKPSQWRIAGKSVRRLDTADKVDGRKTFSIDLQLPGMLNAAVMQSPVFGGKLVSYNESKIAKMRGVKGVVKINDSTLAVVADTFWRAKTALAELPVVWDDGVNGNTSSATIDAMLREGLAATGDFWQRKEGDAPAAIAQAAKKVEATYTSPFLAHATMEPMNCTVRITGNRAEAWVPTQSAEGSLAALAEATGFPLAQCDVYKMDLGGGLGRRGGHQEYVDQAAQVAKKFPGKPIKLIWSREEDMTQDFYRPISMAKMSAGIDDKGNMTAFHVRVSGQSLNALLAPMAIKNNKDVRQMQGFWAEAGDAQLGYTFPNLLTEYVMRNTHVPVGPWRGVNTNQNGIYMECFLEECARAAGKDSLEFRRALMKNHPKHLGVLNAVAEAGNWGKPLPPGVFRGIAQFMGYASYSAATAEVSVSPKGEVKVHRMVFALDSGHVVNPAQVRAQIEGSVVMGLSAVFLGENTVEKGRMKERNFDTYPLMHLKETPKVETVLVPTGDFWGGVGEPTICVVGPAVLNAIYAATGKPQRDLPLRKHGLTLV
ncbi:molybdopterin cofactor-binding domain-containing protein [Limnohabitans sp.]|uniref:xanthine dehydrogenase family protein molybdopterin-binding subunit n=1 Tax=Limnohabitans sp. TaxID=1907725 RepID=UPI00286EE887|nr:molybdopterin cofactor-binding domain-containing protein [Limnohabitans sp.]